MQPSRGRNGETVSHAQLEWGLAMHLDHEHSGLEGHNHVLPFLMLILFAAAMLFLAACSGAPQRTASQETPSRIDVTPPPPPMPVPRPMPESRPAAPAAVAPPLQSLAESRNGQRAASARQASASDLSGVTAFYTQPRNTERYPHAILTRLESSATTRFRPSPSMSTLRPANAPVSERGALPPADAVRVEEMVNYFSYASMPDANRPLSRRSPSIPHLGMRTQPPYRHPGLRSTKTER
jgi:hypothetical protein